IRRHNSRTRDVATLVRHRTRLIALFGAVQLVVAACGTGTTAIKRTSANNPSTTTGVGPTSTAAAPPPPPPVMPLTGLAPTDPAAVGRPVLAVKIDNVAVAHPQSGINQADVVYEEL